MTCESGTGENCHEGVVQESPYRTFYIVQGKEPAPVVPQDAFFETLEKHDAIVHPRKVDTTTTKKIL